MDKKTWVAVHHGEVHLSIVIFSFCVSCSSLVSALCSGFFKKCEKNFFIFYFLKFFIFIFYSEQCHIVEQQDNAGPNS